jgi:ribonuclease P protein component
MDPKHRLTGSSDIRRVREVGRSYAHPLVVLVASPNEMSLTRFAVTGGRQLGSAVRRNRAKRRLRAALRPLLPLVRPGWDVVCIARAGLPEAAWPDIERAVAGLCRRAGLMDRSE